MSDENPNALVAHVSYDYAKSMVAAALRDAFGGLNVYITGPDDDGDFWLHINESKDAACGFNIGSGLGEISQRLLAKAATPTTQEAIE